MILGLENQHFYNIEKVGRQNVSVFSVSTYKTCEFQLCNLPNTKVKAAEKIMAKVYM